VALAQLDGQLGLEHVQCGAVLARVVPAEQQLPAGREDRSEHGRGTAAVTAVEPGEERVSRGLHGSLLRRGPIVVGRQ
jgi:hypothetical protein